ncbi:F-box protein At5g67140 isoform X2 [Pistacia vera]|uniref:F-box protein At5g67140 isoform X2 n=1 Tax=Pistacia vera TaxID=55513 RepID=UPI001263E2C5|nr:F-box protein At5g67140 isoform X2 [Pistacia vera]
MEVEAQIDQLPIDLLAHIFVLITSFTDLAQASSVCKKWKVAVKQSLALRENLSFAGWKMDDDSTARLVGHAYSLKELEISRSRWDCQITDKGLYRISLAKCISNLTCISLWGLTGITDRGVIQVISRASSLKHLNIGGTFVTDESLYAIANSCPQLKKLESINVWGTRIPVDCFIGLLTISPALQIKPEGLLLNVGNASMLPVV